MCVLASKTAFGAAAVFLWLALSIAAFAQSGGAQAPQAPSPAPLTDRSPGSTGSEDRPAYLQLRYKENWSFLRDESKRDDSLDRIKYIPLGRENWYVTVGGEVRLYYENFRNETWGAEPEDDSGFWLQRFMLHADWRLGARVRVFSQLKSGEIEDRVGGPRPPDKDDLDVHQLFVDYNFSTEKNKSLTVRVGRQEMSFGSSRLIGFRYQFGSFGKGRINAWTFASDTGYTFDNAPLRPRLGFKADVTSGDKDPNDPDLQTFNALFPKGAYFGELSPIGPYNHMDLHPAINLKLSKHIELLAEWVWYWRTSVRDGVYGVPGNLERTGNASAKRFVGQSFYTGLHFDLNRHTTLDTVFARFLVGAFLRDAAPSSNTTYVSAWLTYKF